MAGRRICRGNGVAAGAVAAAAVGSALAAGSLAASRAGQTGQEEDAVCLRNGAQETGEDTMPMCRHVNPISTAIGCCSVEKQLWELNQVLDYQNRILVELLQAVRERSANS